MNDKSLCNNNKWCLGTECVYELEHILLMGQGMREYTKTQVFTEIVEDHLSLAPLAQLDHITISLFHVSLRRQHTHTNVAWVWGRGCRLYDSSNTYDLSGAAHTHTHTLTPPTTL